MLRTIVNSVFACASLVCAASVSEATIRRVDLNATGTPIDGSTWSRAYRHLQNALAVSSSGDEILVAQGTYTPDPTSPYDTNVSFVLISGVKVKGGFAGVTETNPDDNDPVAYPTILSGDLANDDDQGCAIDDSGNSTHVVKAGAVVSTTILEGFMIRAGNASGFDSGGGLQITSINAELQVINCTFTCNRAENGGGVDHGSSQSDYIGCTFENNVALKKGGGLWSGDIEEADSVLTMTDCDFLGNQAGIGGAVAAEYVSNASYQGCYFAENVASHSFIDGGGAVYHNVVNDTLITTCAFDSNEAGGRGGALWEGVADRLRVFDTMFEANNAVVGGGAVRVQFCDAATFRGCVFLNNETDSSTGGALDFVATPTKVVDCGFVGNRAADGGAVYSDSPSDSLTLINVALLGNLAQGEAGAVWSNANPTELTNCLLAGNEAVDRAGLYLALSSIAPRSKLFNCTIADNVADDNGRGVWLQTGYLDLINCILWGNGTTTANQIAKSGSSSTDFFATYTDTQGGALGGTGNINLDPLFVDTAPADPTLRNYRLTLCSPTIDVGNNSDVPADSEDVNGDTNTTEPTPDLDIHPRIVDNPFVAGSGAVVDLGAYEWQVPTCATPGDLNDDTYVNGLDIQPFVDCVIPGDPAGEHCDCGDINMDGATDYYDIPCFVQLLLGNDACLDCSGERGGLVDCNANGVTDDLDLFFGTSADCNQNFIPDECDIADETSVDIDGNGVPDECQPDCNGNDIPDAWDIDPLDPDGNEEVSADCNENGIPDECERDCNSNGVPDDCDVDPLDPDGDEWVSADCNANGIPDECEADCNHNGVPDGCDLDPADPDGDEWVSPDCNENGVPDECEFSLPPPLGSYDCNDNDVPDECDIADETSCDANANGVPDECEIALEACDDLDEDGCCDEGESLMGGGQGGGESMMGGEGGESSSESESTDSQSPCAELTEAECWDLYFEWAMEQCWGRDCEATGFEQFRAARAKLAELGLTWPM